MSEEITSKKVVPQKVVIDEIQKLPQLLDEVHRMIEERGIRFLLTGGLPMIWSSDEYWTDLQAYVHLYLKEEIIAEAIVRKVDHYARFLDVIGHRSGDELNYQQISSDSAVPVRTVANFVEVLKDTLLAFEHFMIQEIRAYLGYSKSDLPLTYWRTVGDKHEVDCVIGDTAAVEFKSFETFSERSLSGLRALKSEKKVKNFYLISRDPIRRKIDGIEILPYDAFLQALWDGEII